MQNPILNIGWSDYIKYCYDLCGMLKTYANEKSVIVTAPRGGYIPSGIVAYQLNIGKIFSCGYKSYVDRASCDYFLYQELPAKKLTIETDTIFLIDDIVDTSKTISNIGKMINGIGSVARVYTASVFVKKANKHSVDFFAKEIPDNVWIQFPYDEISI